MVIVVFYKPLIERHLIPCAFGYLIYVALSYSIYHYYNLGCYRLNLTFFDKYRYLYP